MSIRSSRITEVSQPQRPRSGPDGQPIESSKLERAGLNSGSRLSAPLIVPPNEQATARDDARIKQLRNLMQLNC
jgi:hypothetical protein